MIQAHHSTAAIEDAGSAAQSVRRGVPRNGVVTFLFHHLHLALASPSLFRVPFLVQKHSNNNGCEELFDLHEYLHPVLVRKILDRL
jgi:hypothetical protein